MPLLLWECHVSLHYAVPPQPLTYRHPSAMHLCFFAYTVLTTCIQERERHKIHAECQNAKSVPAKQSKPKKGYTEKIYPILKPKATPVEPSRNEEIVIWKQISWSSGKGRTVTATCNKAGFLSSFRDHNF